MGDKRMRFHYRNQREMPYGSMSIIICTEENGYMPTNEEVIPIAREVFGIPTDPMLGKISARLYWKDNLRVFEFVCDVVYAKRFRNKNDYSVYNMMQAFKEAAESSGWIATMGNNRIDKVWGFVVVKIVE